MRPLLLLSLALALSAISSAQAQDVAAGEKLFLQCRACHQVGDTARNAVGPALNGLFGRESMQTRGGWLPIAVGFGLTERGWAGAEAGVACEAGGGAGARRDHETEVA